MIVVLGQRWLPGNVEVEVLFFKSPEPSGYQAWELRQTTYKPGTETIAAQVPKSAFLMAGTLWAICVGLVDKMADWGCTDDECIAVHDFTARLDGFLQTAQGVVQGAAECTAK